MNRSWCALLVLWTFIGCGAPPGSSYTAASAPAIAPAAEDAKTESAQADAAAPKTPKQIIYRATLVLHVEDFSAAESEIKSLIQATGGYVAQFREDRSQGAQRGGQWTVRIPVPQFNRFVDAAGKLGVTDTREVTADDVTEEYVDLEARLKNKQQLEARLLELVAKRTDEIKDVIAVEAELSRVREEIERMQGRLRYLADRVAMTTVQITAYERHDYRPPEATFAGRVAHTFRRSLDLMREFGEAWVLIVVGLAPWLVLIALILGPIVWYVRRRIRRAGPTIVQATPA